jgi:methenyltetrahydromethanopterin cyclohydrolase
MIRNLGLDVVRFGQSLEEEELTLGHGLNQAAYQVFLEAKQNAEALRIRPMELECGAQLIDFGVSVPGGIEAGVRLASICMAGQADVRVVPGERHIWPGPWIQMTTDRPLHACMLAQYAGWPVKHGKFFAMGSGPMRVCRGKEELLASLAASDIGPWAVGTLECDSLPGNEVVEAMAAECGVRAGNLLLAIAPTRSLAGCLQVVARCVETCLHKLHELGFELSAVRSAYGIAPLPPPTPDFALGIGRTNDAILFGGHVSLWVDADDDEVLAIGDKLPSSSSGDFGRPFAEIFKSCQYDFYKIDPGLFSPAEVCILNFRSGRSWRFGKLHGDLVSQSFATQAM